MFAHRSLVGKEAWVERYELRGVTHPDVLVVCGSSVQGRLRYSLDAAVACLLVDHVLDTCQTNDQIKIK